MHGRDKMMEGRRGPGASRDLTVWVVLGLLGGLLIRGGALDRGGPVFCLVLTGAVGLLVAGTVVMPGLIRLLRTWSTRIPAPPLGRTRRRRGISVRPGAGLPVPGGIRKAPGTPSASKGRPAPAWMSPETGWSPVPCWQENRGDGAG